MYIVIYDINVKCHIEVHISPIPPVPTPMSIFQFPPDGKIFPIMCHGDQNSVEKIVEANCP